ncbi:MAG: class I SAM-dependent rRNA methyltransferase [Planctomycetota bacterium]|nr:class I SAM-dependent rRNA methyltransferase [Planctomycetota bacterium]
MKAAQDRTCDAPVRLTEKASQLAAKGHPWFYRDDLQGSVESRHGTLVRVASDGGHDLGLAFCSARSRLALRRCGVWPGNHVPSLEEFFHTRLETAWEQRVHFTEEPRGVRIVNGDADWLPGLIVDQYGPCLVLQSSTALVENALGCIVPWLKDRVGAESILARNDIAVRRREDLPEEIRLLEGRRVESTWIQEHGIRHRVQLYTGQKTGFYLDQRPARRWVKEHADGRRSLDLFCYQGGFSLAALAGGASEVTAVDQSEAALAELTQAAQANGLSAPVTECADVFDWVRAARRRDERFDLIVLDPPAFARSRRERDGALRGYRDLNRQALRLLAPGGYLLTCSCSHHVTGGLFEGVLRQAASELTFPVLIRGRIAAGEDHPVWVSLPETEYLKVVVLQRPQPCR